MSTLTKTEELGYEENYNPFIEIEDRELQVTSRRLKTNWLEEAIIKEAGKEVKEYVNGHFDLSKTDSILYASPNQYNYELLDFDKLRVIINFKKINLSKDINEFFRSIHKVLPDAGLYIGSVESYDDRRNRIYSKGKNLLTKSFNFLDSIFNHYIPRIKFLKDIYFSLSKGKGLTISLAETLGRAVYCGFSIIEYRRINNTTYFVLMKTKEPQNGIHSTSNPIIKLPRIGKNGKMINVYKFRTMHPYSEFLQDFVLKLNGYSEIGKPANDFRITKWGKFLRRYWLDEMPQIINVLKGEMKLVGIRPVSKRFFKEYPDELKAIRIKYKPGCVPPYVALLKQDVSEYIESEKIYFSEKSRHPYTTDLRYLSKAFMNIFLNKIRSS